MIDEDQKRVLAYINQQKDKKKQNTIKGRRGLHAHQFAR